MRWHCSGECFTRDEFVRVNCDYPGLWRGEVERVEHMGDIAVTAARVWTDGASFHVCSFFRLREGRISELDEYWGDDGPAPAWRREMGIGRAIGKQRPGARDRFDISEMQAGGKPRSGKTQKPQVSRGKFRLTGGGIGVWKRVLQVCNTR